MPQSKSVGVRLREPPQKPAPSAKMGRPSIYSEELVDRIMAEVIAGHSIHQICKRPEFPAEAIGSR